ncbi:YozE family protein [Aerococcus sanguinicola]|uniref:D-alanyl-D-alanine carboxypeptidase n=1 Tax=Aerococcus sanguinicola TaxID=119206 RepID=A0A0X8FCH6_9LACT|nr:MULTISPECIES: YozE family protein [Aerococcus]AMB94801.1 hypothetical protein AWM72_08545 [Aerococcus sanguinicola]MDK7049572.1 YozE family protein [Aerococcus sanguinicola]OFT96345.1 hypothetical protein HMPREF3090_02875 [Aerococcus sp. HMSC23C02]PKZ23198.1 D-alanyl-D-alanine carboxypeptidase [Aerococcus sanguinicola]
MSLSFYRYVERFRGRGSLEVDQKEAFADLVYRDLDFPRDSKEFDEISRYIEGHSDYADYISCFDDLWQAYDYEQG